MKNLLAAGFAAFAIMAQPFLGVAKEIQKPNLVFLLLDDLGRDLRTGNNLPQSTFDSILRTRVQEGRTTLITTNMSMRELETGYGAASLSMLKEVSLRIEVNGSDFRPRANARTLTELDDDEMRPIT